NEQTVLGDVGGDVVGGPVEERRQLVLAGARIFAEGPDVPALPAFRSPQVVDQNRRVLGPEVREQRGFLSRAAALGLIVDAREQLAPVQRLLRFGRRRRVE